MIVCCHNHRPGEANIFIYFPWPPVEAASSVFKVSYLLKTVLYKGLLKTNEIALNAEPQAF